MRRDKFRKVNAVVNCQLADTGMTGFAVHNIMEI